MGARLTQGRTGGLGVGHLGVKMLRSGENPTKDDDGDDDDDDDADDDVSLIPLVTFFVHFYDRSFIY